MCKRISLVAPCMVCVLRRGGCASSVCAVSAALTGSLFLPGPLCLQTGSLLVFFFQRALCGWRGGWLLVVFLVLSSRGVCLMNKYQHGAENMQYLGEVVAAAEKLAPKKIRETPTPEPPEFFAQQWQEHPSNRTAPPKLSCVPRCAACTSCENRWPTTRQTRS